MKKLHAADADTATITKVILLLLSFLLLLLLLLRVLLLSNLNMCSLCWHWGSKADIFLDSCCCEI